MTRVTPHVIEHGLDPEGLPHGTWVKYLPTVSIHYPQSLFRAYEVRVYLPQLPHSSRLEIYAGMFKNGRDECLS